MPKRYRIELSDTERKALERWTKNPPRPYLRERARAILRVAEDEPIYKVAQSLRIRVHRTTVTEWVRRYQEEGITGLKIRPGRGRKKSFFPSDLAAGQGSSGADAASISEGVWDQAYPLASARRRASHSMASRL